jgi:hypothetical protein
MRTGKLFIILVFILQLYTQVFAQEYLAIAYYNKKAGFVNVTGKWYIEPAFDEVTGFINGRAAVKSDGKWGYIRNNGEYAIPPRFDKAEPFENPTFALVESDHRKYYIGRDGENLSESDTGIVIFYDDLAILKTGNKYGYLTRDNQWKIKPLFEMAWPFKNGYARVKKDGEWIYINKLGDKVDYAQSSRSILSPDEMHELNRKIENGKWGFINNLGNWVINPKFDYVNSFSEGFAPVRISNRWGYIDTLGNIKIPLEYEEAFIFTNGLACVKINGKYGCIDKKESLVIKPKFDNPLLFNLVQDYDESRKLSAGSDIKSIKSITIPYVSESLVSRYVPADRRLALIIGNGNYSTGSYLVNPANDAKAMAETLEKLGFVVKIYVNLGQIAMKQAIDEFGEMLKKFDIGLFFYAGHGVQVKGYNYLIPVDASITREGDVEYNCVEAGRVLSVMEESGSKTNIVILDACRNNPFERSWTRSAAGQGLAFMNAPSGSLVAYSTAPGHTASDGSGINGLYTASLLKYINIPGITILEVFQQVRSEVRQKSGNGQVPWESTSLEGNFYFRTK